MEDCYPLTPQPLNLFCQLFSFQCFSFSPKGLQLSKQQLCVFFYRHHDLAVVEVYVRGRRKPKGRPAAAKFLYLEMDYPVVNFELQRERRLSEIRVHCLDPLLKSLWIKSAHVANQD